MVLLRLTQALAAASMLAMAAAASADSAPSRTQTVSDPIATPTVVYPAKAMVDIGCYPTAASSMENHGFYLYRTAGNCQLVCLSLQKNVLAVSDGENCWCGDRVPNPSTAVSNSSCDTPCAGDKSTKCGGPNLLWVALTGNSLNRVDADPAPSNSSSTPSSTPSSEPTSKGKSGGTNTVAIAAGVVVAIVGLAAIGAGVWLFLRRKRQRQAEEDYRRNAANTSQFINGGKLSNSSSSMNDSRLDPSFGDRRQSNGSIADNEDYSRRILKVTNV